MMHLSIPDRLQANIETRRYESGHMVYAVESQLHALHDNVADFIRRTVRGLEEVSAMKTFRDKCAFCCVGSAAPRRGGRGLRVAERGGSRRRPTRTTQSTAPTRPRGRSPPTPSSPITSHPRR